MRKQFNRRCIWIGSVFTIIISLLLYFTDDNPARNQAQATAHKLYQKSLYIPPKK
ncbi:MAG TPA: hypothetical protein VIM75_07765 [Ohtaekwangia sp.]|uniref:hypothetical protein n=1 Tax=Ohtaekwangia sp. TaxID=2066019 RepID=UPI002F959C51